MQTVTSKLDRVSSMPIRLSPPAVVFLFCTILLVAPLRAEHPAAQQIFPADTVAFLRIPSLPLLKEKHAKSSGGRMLADPQVAPLVSAVAGSVMQNLGDLKEKIGATLEELAEVPQGEVSLGVVLLADAPFFGLVGLVDCGDKRFGLETALHDSPVLHGKFGEPTDEVIGDTRVSSYKPPKPNTAGFSYCIKDETLLFGTTPELAKFLLANFGRGADASFAKDQNFLTVLSSCKRAGDDPNIIWYVDPIAIIKQIQQTSDNFAVRMGVAMLPALGVDGLLGAGGALTLVTDEFDMVIHSHLLLRTPRAGVVNVPSLMDGDPTPAKWVPADTSDYKCLYLDAVETYRRVIKLIDSFQGEGTAGRWIAAMEDRGKLGINLEQDLFGNFSGRITIIQYIEKPVSPNGAAGIWAFDVKDAKKAETTLNKFIEAGEGRWGEKRNYAGLTYFAQKMPPNLPYSNCICLLHGTLIYSNREPALQQLINNENAKGESLASTLDYKIIASKISRLVGEHKPSVFGFSRPEIGMRWMYDMANSPENLEKMAASNAVPAMFKGIPAILKEQPLPPFAVLQQYLAPGGSFILDEETGFHHVAFVLRRK
jgi:hypothetical protein